MPAGRPTKYNAAVLEAAKQYIEDWESYGDAIPSHARLAITLHVAESTILYWANMEGNEEFSKTLEILKTKQHMVLANKGLTNEHNSTITKLLLAKHGHSEKTERRLSGAVGMVDLSDKTDAELEDIINGND